MSIEKLLPQNMDAEAGVLGSLLIDTEALHDARAILAPEDFYREAHRAIYSAMLTLHQAGEPADIITVTDELARRGKLDDIGGISYVSSLANQVPTSANLAHYARIVARCASLRRLIRVAGQIAAVAYNDPDSDSAFIEAHKLLRGAEHSRTGSHDSIPFSAAVDTWLASVHASLQSGGMRGVLSGFDTLDVLTMGFKPGELWYIPGRPGSGKSAFALAIAEHNAQRFTQEGRGCVEYVTLEMQATQQVQRILAARANINGRALRADFFEGDEFQEDVFAKAERVAFEQQTRIGQALRFYDKPMNLAALEAHLTRAVEERECRLAVVDYLGLITGDDPRADEYKRLTRLSFAMKQLAMKLDIPIICLLQMNRDAEKRENKRPVLSDLRDSGGLEQDADGVIGIYRPAYYNRGRAGTDTAFAQFMELWIIKARSSIGNAFAPVRFEDEFTRLSEWPREWDYPQDDSRPGSK